MNSILISDLHIRSLKRKLIIIDLVIKLKDGKIFTDLYCKSTDSHQCLHYDSCHAEHIKRSIIFSQTFQLKRFALKKVT